MPRPRRGRCMFDVDAALVRIEMDAIEWLVEFESALERIAIREDRSRVRPLVMTRDELEPFRSTRRTRRTRRRGALPRGRGAL